MHSVLEGLHVEKAILVGHSYGAAIVMAFATLHPERVHSLLLIDPTAPSFETEDGPDRPSIVGYPERTFGVADPKTTEAYPIASSLEWVAKNPMPMAVPLTVMTAMGINREWSSSRKQTRFTAHSLIGQRSSRFHHVKAPESNHYIMIKDPNLVFDVIKREVESIKRLLSGAK